MGRNRV
ncbi:hypothetical protein VCHFU02_3747, partial [Vibrio cholerae HFU-02]